MTTTNLLYAIEALGYDEESICISKKMKYYVNSLRVTFFKNHFKNREIVGSKYEGLEPGLYMGNKYINIYDDWDCVYYIQGIPMSDNGRQSIIAANDLTIIPLSKFPGYVHLQLPEPFRSFLPNNFFNECVDQIPECQEVKTVKITQNGPAITQYISFTDHPIITKKDNVMCFLFKSWPEEANKWVNRNKPNKWPCQVMIAKIKSKGFTLAPVGHSDCTENEFQWRIGIQGERELLSNLNRTQIMCYVALKLILKGDIHKINEDALSSFHAKNVIFWCVEQESCQWTKQNFDICLKTCINRLIKFLESEHFPHYFIEDRNLINSKMTPQLKEQIVEALTKYSNNSLAILSISFFDRLRDFTNFKFELLDCAKQMSVIEKCMRYYVESFGYLYEPHFLWETYQGHNTDVNLKNAQDILYILRNTKNRFNRHYIAYAKNMLGLLCFSRYNETGSRKDISKVRKLMMSSLTFGNLSLEFRAATFLFMEKDFTKCLNVCNSFLKTPNKYKSSHEQLLLAGKMQKYIAGFIYIRQNNVTELTELKRKVLTIFYDKCLPEKGGDKRQLPAKTLLGQSRNVRKMCKGYVTRLTQYASHDNLLSDCKNFKNLVFRNISCNVPFLASEKWAVPRVFQYELLSVQKCHPDSCVYGIYIDPRLNCLVLKFLCYQETNMLQQRDNILTTLNNYINEYPILRDSRQSVYPELPHSLPPYRVYNIVAYCCFKAGSYNMAFNHIKNSFELYGYPENTAYGYIRCVCGILNSLYDK